MTDRLRAALIFISVFVALVWLYGTRLILTTNDEGICLEAAQRMLQGQKLYVDFFGYMSPGSYWAQELSFRLFGVTMLAARMPVLLYFSIECAVLYWLTSLLSSRVVAAVAVIFFCAFQTADSAMLTAQHRWDSGAIVLLAIAAAIHAQSSKSRFWIAIAGGCCSLAAIFTPSVALVGIATFVWLALWRPGRPLAMPFATGCFAMGAVLLAWMWHQGILFAFAAQMRWLSQNYSDVNFMPYGAIIGGYGSILAIPVTIEFALRVAILICLALPAILPIFSALGWGAALSLDRKHSSSGVNASRIMYLVVCMLALIASAYPRLDVMHLAYAAAIPYVLSAALMYHYLPRSASGAILVFLTLMGTVFCLYTLAALASDRRVKTPIGSLSVNSNAAPQVESLLSRIRPQDVLYIHPYKPLFYFVTQAKNPTRYSYLAAGMMKQLDEQIALRGLQEHSPKWILLLAISREEFLRVFPSGDPSTMQYKSIERWIHERYSPVNPPVMVSGYQLYQANGAPQSPKQTQHTR